MKDATRKIFYNTVLSQAFSECGNFLFAGNIFGDIFVLRISDVQKLTENVSSKSGLQTNLLEPIQIFNVGQIPVKSLEFYRTFLIVGTVETIRGYEWDDERCMLAKQVWEVVIPSTLEALEATDINYLHIGKETQNLYVGCGDNLIYLVSLEDGKIVRNFKGHKDFIHCVTSWEDQLYSASEDGSIMVWSPKQENHLFKLEPYKNSNLVRPEYGKWQGTVSATNDWLICGGGPKSSMWHLRSLECTNVLPFPGKAHCSAFLEDLILIAGEHPFLHQYSFNGEIAAEIPISGPAAYSLVWQRKPFDFMSVAGASNLLDICTNFNYKDIFVKLYKAEN